MAKVKTIEENKQQAAKRKRLRTVTKGDKFISGVVREFIKENYCDSFKNKYIDIDGKNIIL